MYHVLTLKSRTTMDGEGPIIAEKGRHFLRRFLVVIAALVIFGLVLLFFNRAPDFSGSKVSSIEIKIYGGMISVDSEILGRELLLESTLTDSSVCASIFKFLSSAYRGSDHKCPSIGLIEIHYADGKIDTIEPLHGHDPEYIEFRFDDELYLLPREQFLQILRDAGVDTSKIPVSGH
jgi:hypothetical protein